MHNFLNLFNLTSITGESKFKAIVALVTLEGVIFDFLNSLIEKCFHKTSHKDFYKKKLFVRIQQTPSPALYISSRMGREFPCRSSCSLFIAWNVQSENWKIPTTNPLATHPQPVDNGKTIFSGIYMQFCPVSSYFCASLSDNKHTFKHWLAQSQRKFIHMLSEP